MLKMLHELRRQRTADEAGLTVIEMLVAMIVLAIIMTPLLMSFITSLTVADSTGDQYRGAANRDRLASFLSRDAASVDAAGVSVILGCRTAAQPVDDTLLVSFSTTRLIDNPTDPTKPYRTNRASYWVSGSGKAAQLVRRSCVDVSLGAPSDPVDGVQSIVATRIGTSATTATLADHLDLAHGPDVGGSIRRNPCDEISCTIVVAGENAFQSTAQRRVFGAGVPLEINKLYSSSADASQDATNLKGNLLVHTTLAGSDTAEALWPGQISLAPGIDPEPAMLVEVRVQQRFTTGGAGATDGQELYYNGGNDWVAADTWLAADFNTVEQQWALPLPASAFTKGGEYRVWTRLTPTGQPTKVYGGSDPTVGGFPLWVDWKIQDSVFVDAASGDDNLSGVKPTEPVRTLIKALQVAYDGGRAEIHVLSAGSFDAVTIAATGAGQTRNNTALIGGYAATGWTRGAVGTTPGAPSTIVGPNSGTNAGTGLVVTGAVRDVRFRQIALNSGATADTGRTTTDSLTAYGLKVLAGAGVILEQSTVTAQNGFTPWNNGIEGAIGTTGCLGRQGASTKAAQNTGFDLPPRWVDQDGNPHDDDDGTRIYIGPVPDDCNSPLRGGYGGGGGNGSNGQPGTDGLGNKGGRGGPGRTDRGCPFFGIPGVDNEDPGGGAGRGGLGGAPVPGSSGIGGGQPSNVAMLNSTWQPADGADGHTGIPGSGGGGSGGGGRRDCARKAIGGQGASGGHGGQGGQGGEGGLAGGSSFGIYLHGASSSVALRSTFVITGNGGNGKNGGWGGNGGQGGSGGNGNYQPKGGTTSGAGGGSGGDGGGAGGGGEGGWSIPIMTANAENSVDLDATVTLTSGVPGQPGLGGTPGRFGRGGAGGLGVDDSILWGLIDYSTVGGTNGAEGQAGTIGLPNGAADAKGAPGTACPSSHWAEDRCTQP